MPETHPFQPGLDIQSQEPLDIGQVRDTQGGMGRKPRQEVSDMTAIETTEAIQTALAIVTVVVALLVFLVFASTVLP